MWVDQLAEELLRHSPGPHVVNDAKTPSGTRAGRSPSGRLDARLRGAGAARRRGRDVVPLRVRRLRSDGRSPAVPAGVRPLHGDALFDDPVPGRPRPELRARTMPPKFAGAFQRLGAHPDIYRTSEMYRAGRFDDGIRRALDQVDAIRAIYRDVAHSKRIDDHWWPVQMVCERCGRIGTTSIVAWDGREVEYVCAADKVAWAEGCGYRGKRAPFGGASKLLYRVEWPAKWSTLGVTVEGAGKDHMTRGGHARRGAGDQRAGVRTARAVLVRLRVRAVRRQEDEHVQGGRRDRVGDPRGAAGGARAVPHRAAAAPTPGGVRPGRRDDPESVRRVRSGRGGLFP